MDAATAVIAAFAGVCLTLAGLSTVPAVAVAVLDLAMSRWGASVITLTLLAAVLGRPRPTPAAEPPPAVRLATSSAESVPDAPPGPPSDAAARPPAGALREPPQRSVPGQGSSTESIHTVVEGESLWRIADQTLGERLGAAPTSAQIADFWPRIYRANRSLIGSDPNLILVGQELRIPEV